MPCSFAIPPGALDGIVLAALGAPRRDVLKIVIGEGMRLAVRGLVVGPVVADRLSGSLESLLFGVDDTDAMTFIVISSLLASVWFAAPTCPLAAPPGSIR